MIPTGNAGKSFVSELANLFQAFADGSSLEQIALKAAMVMQVLLLQKPSKTSKAKDHANHLQRRLFLWKNGDIHALLLEGRCIQKHLPKRFPLDDKSLAKAFSKLMFQGRVRSALLLLSRNNSCGLLDLDQIIPTNGDGDQIQVSVREALSDLHPLGKTPHEDTLLHQELPNSIPTNPVLFESIDAIYI